MEISLAQWHLVAENGVTMYISREKWGGVYLLQVLWSHLKEPGIRMLFQVYC